MKSSSCIYLVPSSPIFNTEAVPLFESFDKGNSLNFYSALLLNHIENINSVSNDFNVVYCFDENDKDFLPAETTELPNKFFCNLEKKEEPLKILAEKYFGVYTNNLIIFLPGIGFSSPDIKRAFNLLQMDDEVIVIGKSFNQQIAFAGFNRYNNEVFENINCQANDFDNFLATVNKHENFVNIMGNYLFMKDLNDFKQLYVELSQKESWAYCSQKLHEKFTHLFIEYKDLLK